MKNHKRIHITKGEAAVYESSFQEADFKPLPGNNFHRVQIKEFLLIICMIDFCDVHFILKTAGKNLCMEINICIKGAVIDDRAG